MNQALTNGKKQIRDFPYIKQALALPVNSISLSVNSICIMLNRFLKKNGKKRKKTEKSGFSPFSVTPLHLLLHRV